MQREKTFLEHYGKDNFSMFMGSCLFYRGIDKDGRKMVAGFVPVQQNDYNNTCFINAFVNKENNCFLDYDPTPNSFIMDTSYVDFLVKRFIEYGIAELRVDTLGNVAVAICEDDLELFRFVNEKELLRYSKEVKWKELSDNWYKQD